MSTNPNSAAGEPASLPAASSLMSSRWSEDNLVSCHPARLYTGRIRATFDQESLGALLGKLVATTGPLAPEAARMGVCTWDVTCGSERGPLIVQLPLALDEEGERGRSRSSVPQRNAANMAHFIQRGLTRYVLTPERVTTLDGQITVAVFRGLSNHHALTFGRGALRVELSEEERSWRLALGPRRTAELLTEMIAALAYHYEPDEDGGTALTDVFVNDGDFVVKRDADGSFALRLTAARQREAGIGPSLLLLYLIQLDAFEDFAIDGKLSGLPTLISNPSLAFEGLVRGLRYRFQDLGRPAEEGAALARQWIRDFARNRSGHAYRPWVERYLAGELPPEFGEDLRERWWRLLPLRRNRSIRALSARRSGDANEAHRAEGMAALLAGLSAEIGRRPPATAEAMRLNDLDRAGLIALLARAETPAPHDELATELLAHWPYRDSEHLRSLVPGARALEPLPLEFGELVSSEDEGTLGGVVPARDGRVGERTLANPELFGDVRLDPARRAEALAAFASFETFMDSALHDPRFGFYATSVVIGRGGHFSTHPELLSPHYGAWLAQMAFASWQDLCAQGELSGNDPFPVIEFGAGNGRLARDFLDAVAARASAEHSNANAAEHAAWQTFAACLEYRIYELSASLRDKQAKLLGRDARVENGDARRPAGTLKRDFPEGLRGFVVTNEVPDAFGVHKVHLTREGHAFAALVVPRVEPELRQAFGAELGRSIGESDARLRATFALGSHPSDAYLDTATYERLMAAMAALPAKKRGALACKLWLEETYVPASSIPPLAEHLRANAEQYATALAAEDSGIVCYVNVHAGSFMRELGQCLVAGSIVTIDYGDTVWGLVEGARRGDFPFRIYRDGDTYQPRPNDPYTVPGMQDMTADVNFSELAQAGQAAGLAVVHYGLERDLAGSELPRLLDSLATPGIPAFLGDDVFRVLVLGARQHDVLTGPLTTPLPLWCTAEDVPAARRPLIESIRRALEGSVPEAQH